MKIKEDCTRVIIDDYQGTIKDDHSASLRDRMRLHEEINSNKIDINYNEFRKTLEEKIKLSNARLSFNIKNPNFKFTKIITIS